MREVFQNLHNLGRTYGSGQRFTTTFKDEGMVSANSPLRACYAHIEPTLVGFCAGYLQLLRIPQFMHVIKQTMGSRSLLECMLDDLKIALAAIYGDTDTAHAASNIVFVGQQVRLREADLPTWMDEAREFTTGDPKLRTAVTAIMASTVAQAHQQTGVLVDGKDGTQYCRDLVATLGFVTNANLEGITTLQDLHKLANETPGTRLMKRDQLTEADGPALINDLMMAELAPGYPVATFAPMIKGLLPATARQVLGGGQTPSEKNDFAQWRSVYSERVNRHGLLTAEQVPEWSNVELSRLHFFAAAERQSA